MCIYLNHAGTSWPKPDCVVQATSAQLGALPASWSESFNQCHATVADWLHVDAARLLLTPSCTAAITLGIADHPWRAGDRVLTGGYEHHAVRRPLMKLEESGVRVTTIPRGDDQLLDLDTLEAELQYGSVRLVVLTAACNVTGELLPISEAIKLAHRFDALVLVDGAQIAGWWDLDVASLEADLFTFAGHKGPQAPWGIGGLYVSPRVSMSVPNATCEVAPAGDARCASMPGYCDAGSVNMVALAGLSAACDWLREPEQANRLAHARTLASRFTDAMRRLSGVTLYGDVSVDQKMPTVAITCKDCTVSELGAALRRHSVIVSAGFQCAPQAHTSLGTHEGGVVRFSFGPTQSIADIDCAIEIMQRVAAG